MAVTQKEIAEKLGVSRQLVNFALNGVGAVSDQTRREILEAASELGYRRNDLARAVVTGKSRVIGIMSHDHEEEHIAEHIAAMIAGNLDEAAARGYSTKLVRLPFPGPPEALNVLIQRCSTWRLDGTVAVALRENAVELLKTEMRSSGCPVAYLDSFVRAPQDEAIRIATDDYSGIYAAVEHLFGLGHRRITLLSGPADRDLTTERNEIFRRILAHFDLPAGAHAVVSSHWSNAAIVEASVNSLLDSLCRPTALLCAGDAAGMIAMRTARRRGLSVPEHLSVIGYGNFALAAHADPPLTSIGQGFRRMGQIAMQRLLDRIESGGAPVCSTVELLPASLVVRESTAPPQLPPPG